MLHLLFERADVARSSPASSSDTPSPAMRCSTVARSGSNLARSSSSRRFSAANSSKLYSSARYSGSCRCRGARKHHSPEKVCRYPLEVVCPFKDAHIWCRNHLLTPRNGRRQFRTPVQIPSSVLVWTSRMPSPASSRAHSRWPGGWQTGAGDGPGAGNGSYARPAPGLPVASARVWASPQGGTGACTALAHLEANLAAYPPHHAGNRHPSCLPGAVPRVLCARRRGRSAGAQGLRPGSSACWYRASASATASGRGPAGGKTSASNLAALPPRQHMPTIQAQFLGQVLGRDALGTAPQDLYNDRAWGAGFGPDRPGTELADGATAAAAVVDRRTVPVVGRLVVRQPMRVGPVHPVRMADLEQQGVAGLVIKQIIERKLQPRAPSLVCWTLADSQQSGCRHCPTPQTRDEP